MRRLTAGPAAAAGLPKLVAGAQLPDLLPTLILLPTRKASYWHIEQLVPS